VGGLKDRLKDDIGREIAAWQTAVQRFDELAAARLQLHVTDLQIVGLLADAVSLPAGRVAEAAGLSASAATAAIDRLETAGYVRRLRSDADRRQVLVELTPRSRRLIEQIWGPIIVEALAKLERYTLRDLRVLHEFVRWCHTTQLSHVKRMVEETV
jgi:DNA-binding MarR family transcriptional regulator